MHINTELTDNLAAFFTGVLVTFTLCRMFIRSFPGIASNLLGYTRQIIPQHIPTPLHQEEPSGERASRPTVEYSSPTSILRVHEFHNALYARFIRHQELVLQGNYKKALSVLSLFRQQLAIHFSEEEFIIFPLYKHNSSLEDFEIERCLEVYSAEHKKLTFLAEEAENQLREIVTTGAAPMRDLLYVVELETRFKDMFHRYEHRKVKDLYPGAENGMSEEELETVWKEIEDRRQRLGFRFGTYCDLTHKKVELVKRSWDKYGPTFAEQLSKSSATSGLPLPFSKEEKRQGASEGDQETQLLNQVVHDLNINGTFKTTSSKLKIDEIDDLVSLTLDALEKSLGAHLGPSLKDSWTASLNASLAVEKEQEYKIY